MFAGCELLLGLRLLWVWWLVDCGLDVRVCDCVLVFVSFCLFVDLLFVLYASGFGFVGGVCFLVWVCC